MWKCSHNFDLKFNLIQLNWAEVEKSLNSFGFTEQETERSLSLIENDQHLNSLFWLCE